MATTYLESVNRVLRRLNEVELDSSTFSSPRGVHAAVKDAVLDTIRKIYNTNMKWPFNAAVGSQALTIGQEEYSWPSNFLAVEWNSFYIEKNDSQSINTTRLIPITREEWYRLARENDYNAGSDGLAVPAYVFDTGIGGFGITPSTHDDYTVKYRYWSMPTEPSVYSDTIIIPTDFDYVITAGALYHLYLFLDNPERTALAERAFMDGMRNMVNRYFGENHQYAHTPRTTSWPTQSNR